MSMSNIEEHVMREHFTGSRARRIRFDTFHNPRWTLSLWRRCIVSATRITPRHHRYAKVHSKRCVVYPIFAVQISRRLCYTLQHPLFAQCWCIGGLREWEKALLFLSFLACRKHFYFCWLAARNANQKRLWLPSIRIFSFPLLFSFVHLMNHISSSYHSYRLLLELAIKSSHHRSR